MNLAKKKGLGKGLGALLSNTSIDEMIDEKDYVEDIDIDRIKANIDQPRKSFSEEALESLKSSIEKHGIIQPIIVRKKGTKYEIIAGERRYRASKLAKKETIPCIVKEMDDVEVRKIAIIENIQREDLSVMEEALAYRDLLDEYKLTQEELSKELGKSRSYIANTLRLLNLDENTLRLIEDEKITRGHGRALLSIDEEHRQNIINDILEENINVREVEKRVKDLKEPTNKVKSQKSDNVHLKDLEEELMGLLGTKVNLNMGKEKGKIEIEFYNTDDLNRLVDLIKG